MTETNRRQFLHLLGATGAATAGALPPSIARALAIPANSKTGTINDVEHVVILMQENRSFDHHFGTLRGVRGFADPRAVTLPSGQPVWYQKDADGKLVMPFRPPVDNLGLTFLPDPPHGWNDTHAAWNLGRQDQFVPNKGLSAMTYHQRADIPYHYALADAFTVCDAYHCSLLGPTDPNRYHLWSGWVGNDGAAGGPVITNAEAGYDWKTYPERLEAAGISWKIYQDVGVGLNAAGYWGWTSDPYIGNYGDNSLLYFHQYQNAQPGTPLADKAKTGTNIDAQGRDPMQLVTQFRDDVANNRLPQVSWICAPEAFSEHPNHPADYGAWFISQFLDALTANPEVWSKTVLFVNYDEEGGFFDHMVPPTPPMNDKLGASTVSTHNEIFPGDDSHPKAPYGLGMRVPMIVVSPWSKGGWVNSQVFDHTSVIRFLEARFGQGNPALTETNITKWRRTVTGDLTGAFNFAKPNVKLPTLPSTAGYVPPDLVRHADYVVVAPTDPTLPVQETGVRNARPLPYVLHASGMVAADGSYQIGFSNFGTQAAVFHVRDALHGKDAPRGYTVGAGKSLSGNWAAKNGQYKLAVHGPNGFYRAFQGSTGGDGMALLQVEAQYTAADEQLLTLNITNNSPRSVEVRLVDAYGRKSQSLKLHAGASGAVSWNLVKTSGWYDVSVRVDGDTGFLVQLAGHIENGKPSISDPMMGGLQLKA
ncbi:MAG TPA: phospholipase C, phosphocholine-specific [Ideonella sp.]|uniref:phosphocholine-specific phospholipase C n=1 Tax=Ideonella sp. TaxID=1929293 RepID=UPI002BD91006|nr:phospholipase C, phosphocholine-specific [Ideonella sp.]HSI51272.1 phospholipase C, phosphocholine-specific [Ideonella sp.]